jgi:hypothetical protein
MKRLHFLLYALTFICISLPQATRAYTTTHQDAFSVDGKTGVYVIDYSFGHGKYDLQMPLRAIRGTSTSTEALSYEIVNGDGKPGAGTAVGIVFGEAPIKNGMYIVPKGTFVHFRMIVIYTQGVGEASDTFYTQVTNLPFAFHKVQDLSLTPSERASYRTPSITLGKPIGLELIKAN